MNRDIRSKYLQFIITSNTDEPSHWLYTDIVQKYEFNIKPENGLLPRDLIEIVYGTTFDNKKNLPANYIEGLATSLDPKLYQRFVECKWVSLVQGKMFYQFDWEINIPKRELKYDRHLPLLVSSNFNIDPMCWSVWNGIKKNYGASIRSWSRATQIRKHAAGNSRIDIFRTLKTSDMSFGSAMQADGVEAQSHRIPIMILSRTISERTESGLSSKLISLIHQCAIVPMPSMQDSKTAMGFPIYSSTNINARMLFSVSRDVPISPGPLRRIIQKTGIRNQESRLTSATRSDILFTNCSPCVKRQPGVNNHA